MIFFCEAISLLNEIVVVIQKCEILHSWTGMTVIFRAIIRKLCIECCVESISRFGIC